MNTGRKGYSRGRKKKRSIVNEDQCRSLITKMKSRLPTECESRIMQVLTDKGIRFIREYYHPTLFNRKTGQLLFFDFYLPDHKAFIEFDGPHHYKPIYGQEAFVGLKHRNEQKNKYCFRRGLVLVRIPYWMSDNIEKIITQYFG